MPPVVDFGVPAGGVLIPLPLCLTCLDIDGAKKSAQIIEVAGDTYDDVIADD